MSQTRVQIALTAQTKDGDRPLAAAIGELVIAGWTGRNREAMENHIAELEAIGIARPKSVPVFYRVAASLLTVADEIQVSGGHSSGEAETVILNLGGRHYVGVGSDHTDRQAETMAFRCPSRCAPSRSALRCGRSTRWPVTGMTFC